MSEVVDRQHAFLAGGGEMGARMRAHDWAATPLGAPETWPPTLKTMASLVLNSALLGTILWGPELRMIYNDAYAPALQERHPDALGRPIADVWGAVWDALAPSFLRVMATGEAIFERRYELPMERRGRQVLTHWSYSVSPIRDEDGTIVGLLNQAIEITGEVRVEQYQRRAEGILRELNSGLQQEVSSRTVERDAARAAQTNALADAERVQLALAAGAVIGTWSWDLTTDRFTVDEAFAASFGLDPALGQEAIPLAGIIATVHPDDQAGLAAAIDEAIARGGRYAHQYRTRRRDGRYHWLEANGHVEHGPDGTPLRFPGVLIDVAERRALVEERDRALTELRMVTDALPMLVAFVDRTLTYRFANAAYKEWWDLTPEEVVGRTIPALTGADGYAARRPAIEQALAGEAAQVDLSWPRPDGSRRIADIRYLPRRDAGGTVEGFYIFVQDVTALRDATAVLSAQAEMLAREVAERTADLDRVWRRSQELLVVAGADGTLEAVNPVWTELLGWAEHELVGSRFVSYTHPDDLEKTLQVFAGIVETPLVQPYEYRFRHKDGSYRWFSWTAAFEAGKVVASGRDTTLERRQAEQLVQSQKMEAVGQLTGGLAHDFNNLLAGISGALELMAIRISQGRIRDLDRYMVAAQGAAKRAAALTHRLLAFSRQQTLAPKATNVNNLVTGMLELIQRTVGPGIHVDVVTVAGLWPALVDPSQLENALLNLCINARDAMPGGGSITIETANRWIDRQGARQYDTPEGQYLSLCVSDTGTGMPPEVVAKAFDPFFTTKPIGQGTGLGLSMIYGFARQSGGQVRIYSEPDQGTMVCIYLPRHRGKAEADVAGPERAPAPKAEVGETVLVVDDEPTVRMLVTEVLEELGYTAIEAADSAGGLRVLQSDARIDLLVTDVGLPGGMNGRQMADAARVSRPNLRVLFITGFAENALLTNGQLDPGMAVLTKPFPVDTLAARIRELIVQ